MRFTIQNLCWLMVTVAVASFVACSLPADALTIALAWFGLAYATAPLLLALVSSFFQGIAARKRAVVGYYVLLVLAAIPILFLVATLPWGAVLFAGLTSGIWVVQIEIYSNIHENQENAACRPRRENMPRCKT